MSNEKKGFGAINLKKELLLLLLCPLIVILACSVTIVITSRALVTEGTYEPTTEAMAVITEIPEADIEKTAYLNRLISAAESSGEINVSSEVKVDISDISGSLNDSVIKLAQLVKDGVQAEAAGSYPVSPCVYGETTDILKAVDFNGAQKTEITLTDIPTSDDGNPKPDGNYYYKAVSTGIYEPFNAENGIAACFGTEEDEAAAKKILEGFSPMFISDGSNVIEITAQSFTYEAVIDSLADKISSVTLTKKYDITLPVVFQGEYAGLGEGIISFVVTVTQSHNIKWAGIDITQSTVIIHGNGYDNLAVTANIAEDAAEDEYTLSFTSSDESILTVDENGMIEAVKESEVPVTVEVVLTYIGHTYKDTCTVYVIEETDGISMKSHDLTVKTGESVQVDATVKPKDATIKNIIWISEDESIATVDENGVVTGVSPGTVRIIAVTEINNYMAGCTVTVN